MAAAGRRHRPHRAGCGWTRPAGTSRTSARTSFARLGFEETHPLWIVRRTMVDLIRPIEFQDMLRCRRWCSGTSNRWCEMRVRVDGRKGGLIESEAFWININRETQMPSRISDDFLEGLHKTTSVDRLRWKGYLKPGSRDDASEIHEFPAPGHRHRLVRPHEQLGVLERDRGLPGVAPRSGGRPLRITIEHEAPVALGDKLEIISHVHPAGSTDKFGAGAGRSRCYNAHICGRRRDESRRLDLRDLTGQASR